MRRLLATACALALCSACVDRLALSGDRTGVPFPEGFTGWWDCAFAHRRLITVEYGGTDTLSGFPVPVSFDSTRIDYATVATSGADLRFVAADGKTRLAHEIDTWTENGVSVVWVRVPSLTPAPGTTELWIYHGDPDAADGQDPAAVWADYAGVWHLTPSAGLARDSTAGANHGTPVGAVAAPGAVGSGLSFDGDDRVEAATLEGSLASFTMSMWLRRAPSPAEQQPLLFNVNGTGLYPRLTLLSGGNMFLQLMTGGTTQGYSGTAALVAGSDHHLAATFQSPANTSNLYVDGSVDGSFTFGPGALDGGSSGTLLFGEDPNLNTHLRGVLDEVRISRIVRSPGWIAAESASLSADFTIVGPREDSTCDGSP